MKHQPPSGGCELKRHFGASVISVIVQPPSGGCELKQSLGWYDLLIIDPAAFGRL